MDKEEILQKNVMLYFSSDHGGEEDGAEWHTVNTPATKIYSAMGEYAKLQSIGFAEWIDEKCYRLHASGYWAFLPKSMGQTRGYTTEQLYSLYLTQQK